MKPSIVNAAIIAGFASIVSAQPPPLIISELMINPTVGKENGTWFEIYNPGNQPCDIFVFQLQSKASNKVYALPPGLAIPPKSYFVFGNNKNRATNGNVPVDYEYTPHVEMNELDGLVILLDGLALPIVAVVWGFGQAPAGHFQPGASLSFRNVTELPSTSYIPLNVSDYCVSVTSYGGPAGAKGTPNATNACVIATKSPSKSPTKGPTKAPVKPPSKSPMKGPTKPPTKGPTTAPVKLPTKSPTKSPTKVPTNVRTTVAPTKAPVKSLVATKSPTMSPTMSPVKAPTAVPTKKCELFRLRILCPFTQCGIVGRTLGWCKN
jgi:Lamin Tail Domain